MSDETVPRSSSSQQLFLPGLVVTVVAGANVGKQLPMTSRRFTIGTAPDNDLVLDDPSVSRHHLVLESSADVVTMIDLDSTNGTRVDGVRVVRAIAEPRRRLTIGDTTLEIGVATMPVSIPLSARERFGGLVGRSVAMRELYAILERAAVSDASVLLTGETGTGKELAAEAMHEASARRDGPFVVIDCGAIPSALFESELFGHKKGAFTGAAHDQRGLLVEARGGTVFLDEIGELAPELQPKLLRALERRQVRPVGGTETVDLDVRVIAATHRDLPSEVNRGIFREDLYFRLAVVRVRLPPLRDRREDIPALVRLFVTRLAPDRPDETDRIVDAISHRSFPGNVRELRNIIEEALVLGHVGMASATHASGGDTSSTTGVPDAVYALSYKEASDAALTAFQHMYVVRLLARTGNNVSLAARQADMSRRYLQTLVQRFGISTE